MPEIPTRSLVLAAAGLALIGLGLTLDTLLDTPLELAGEGLAAVGGFCLALALTPRRSD